MMEQLKKWRRDLHQIPELGLQEYQTAAYLRQELEKMGYHWESIIETGTIVFIDYGKESTLAFRSDIDGLPIHEHNDVAYQSRHEGCMHACGHDGHMSALLGFAQRLSEIEYDFAYNILLIFQPAEESPGAAKLVVESGIFEQYQVKAIFGMHLMPTLDEGVIACKSGPLMAMCGELDVTIEGKGAHAGLPQDGIDSIVIASDAIHQYQTMIARRVSRFAPATLNIGKIVGGTARNSVAGVTKLEGTLRCYDEDLFQTMIGYLGDIHDGLQKAYGCHITWSCPPLYPPVLNDLQLYQQFSALAGDDFVQLDEPLMLAEDFAYYQKAIPGLFFFLGTKCDAYQSGLHTETFNFHEEVLQKAVHMYELLAKNIKGV